MNGYEFVRIVEGRRLRLGLTFLELAEQAGLEGGHPGPYVRLLENPEGFIDSPDNRELQDRLFRWAINEFTPSENWETVINCPVCHQALRVWVERAVHEPTTARDPIYRGLLEHMGHVQLDRLRTHDDRPGWHTEPFSHLLDRLDQERDNLREEVQKLQSGQEVDLTRLEREAAGVSNFAAFIVDKARTQRLG